MSNMKIIERYLKGKSKEVDMCEDGLFIGEHVIAVIDGVTAKSPYLWNGKRSGCYAKDVLLEFFNSGIEKYNATELFYQADRFLRGSLNEDLDRLSSIDYPRASVIVYNDIYKEVWSYGDCQCRINDKVYTHTKRIDLLNSELRAFYLQYAVINGETIDELKENDIGRRQIEKNLLMQFEFENRKGHFGYPVINAMGIEPSFIKKYSVTAGDQIVLASDGYPVLERTLNASEEALDYVLKQDPLCFNIVKSTKGIEPGNLSFDDRTFCRFMV